MDKLANRLADKFVGSAGPQELHAGGINEDNEVIALNEEGIGGKFDQATIALFAGLKGLLGVFSLNTKIGLAQGAMDGRWERAQTMLQDKIGGPAPEGFDGH